MKKILLVITIVALTLFSQQTQAQLFPRLRGSFCQQRYVYSNYYTCARCGRIHAYQQRRPVAEIPRKAVEKTAETLREAVETTVESAYMVRANTIRARYGLQPLAVDAVLDSGSKQHAIWMANGGGLRHAGGVAEIIAYNYSGPFESFNQWLNSPAHRSILLSSYYTKAGFGYRRDNYGRVWCCMRFR